MSVPVKMGNRPAKLFDLYEEIGPPTDEQLRRIVAIMRLTEPRQRKSQSDAKAA